MGGALPRDVGMARHGFGMLRAASQSLLHCVTNNLYLTCNLVRMVVGSSALRATALLDSGTPPPGRQSANCSAMSRPFTWSSSVLTVIESRLLPGTVQRAFGMRRPAKQSLRHSATTAGFMPPTLVRTARGW